MNLWRYFMYRRDVPQLWLSETPIISRYIKIHFCIRKSRWEFVLKVKDKAHRQKYNLDIKRERLCCRGLQVSRVVKLSVEIRSFKNIENIKKKFIISPLFLIIPWRNTNQAIKKKLNFQHPLHRSMTVIPTYDEQSFSN